jgi:hypothetical protein
MHARRLPPPRLLFAVALVLPKVIGLLLAFSDGSPVS